MRKRSRHHVRWLLTLCISSPLGGCGADRTTPPPPPAVASTASAPQDHVDRMTGGETGATTLSASASRGAIDAAFATSPTAKASAEPARTIVRLAGHQIITVTTGPRGPRYSASTLSGETIADGLTLDELRASHPEIYREVSGTASAHEGALIADLGD